MTTAAEEERTEHGCHTPQPAARNRKEEGEEEEEEEGEEEEMLLLRCVRQFVYILRDRTQERHWPTKLNQPTVDGSSEIFLNKVIE